MAGGRSGGGDGDGVRPVTERNNNRGNRSCTCGIQKTLYRAQSERFPPNPETGRRLVDSFIRQNQPHLYDDLSVPRVARFNQEILDENNAITVIIARDPPPADPPPSVRASAATRLRQSAVGDHAQGPGVPRLQILQARPERVPPPGDRDVEKQKADTPFGVPALPS